MTEPIRDQQTVSPGGVSTAALPEGVRFRETGTHIDDRGALWELFDPRWDFHDEPLTYSYCFEVRPGKIKAYLQVSVRFSTPVVLLMRLTIAPDLDLERF